MGKIRDITDFSLFRSTENNKGVSPSKMTKTVFYDGITQVKAEFLNAINNPVFRAKPEQDGELPLISNTDLSTAPGQILPSWQEFADGFKVTTYDHLTVAYNGGVYRLTGGSPQVLNSGKLSVPDNAQTYLYLNLSGQIAQSSDYPVFGKILAKVTSVSGSIIQIDDFRSRGIIELASESFLPSDSKLVGSVEALHGPSPSSGWVEQKGMHWVSLTSDTIRSIGAPGSGAGISESWLLRLYTFLYNDNSLALLTSSGSSVGTRPASAAEAWGAKIRLVLPDYRGEILSGATASAAYGTSVGSDTVRLSKNHLPAYNLTVTDPGHAHSIADPTHNHLFNDPGHAHSVSDSTHVHAVADPGHAHGVYDPGHTHFINYSFDEQGGRSQAGPYLSNQQYEAINQLAVWTDARATGVAIFPATTGAYLDSRYANIGIYAAKTGASNSGAATGISIYSGKTNLTVALGGGGQDLAIRPKTKAITWLIFAG
jgi:hypothetical protein